MKQEFTTHEHVGTDGVLHVVVPDEWADMDVTVTVEPASKKDHFSQNLAEALKGRIGLLSFEPSDLSSRTGEAYAEYLNEEYRQKHGSHDAV